MSPTGRNAGTPGVRDFAALTESDAAAIGQEALALFELTRAGLPTALGRIVRLAGDHPEQRLLDALRRALEERPYVRLRTLFPTEHAAQRFDRRAGFPADVDADSDLPAVVASLLESLRAPELSAALGGSLMGLHVRVLGFDARRAGELSSADGQSGDPDMLLVSCVGAGAAPFRIDRRSMRTTAAGEGLSGDEAERLADLADRAQLTLGRPLRLEWGRDEGRDVITSVRTLAFRVPPHSPWRRVALMAADEGAVSPLTVDALDRALGTGEPGPHVERAVKRVFARPYRRLQSGGTLGGARTSVPRAAAQAAKAAREVAYYVADAKRYERSHPARILEVDALDVAQVSDEGVLDALRRRQRLTAECLLLLDRGRVTTLAVLEALEMTLGPLPRECYGALATPRRTRERERALVALARFGTRVTAELGHIPERSALPSSLGREWDKLRASMAGVRALGIDVRPGALGESDEVFQRELVRIRDLDLDGSERARKDAMRRLLATARGRDMGRAREGLVGTLGGLAERVAVVKGVVAEQLSVSLLRLRAAALEAGNRLVERAVLDVPSDALYLTLAELEEALIGEPGAYASRVRLRREDDDRWARFDAPRRV
ncbi:MAG: hypothetical protein KC593_10910 [Myxococcales bacterium]|nr:hypothetical protein [Myxococcales bacterium]MCB9626299.1 hypothetical protein [Sandaracinaceae bacterium]